MNLKQSIKSRIKEFTTLCTMHKVRFIYAFGSSITTDFDDINSDFDLLVEIENDDPIERGENLMRLWDKLEEFFQRKVDLLTPGSIKNPVLRKSIDNTKTLIYDGKSQEVSV